MSTAHFSPTDTPKTNGIAMNTLAGNLLSVDSLSAHVKEAYRQWGKPSRDHHPFTDLMLYKKQQRLQGTDPQQTLNDLLDTYLQRVADSHFVETLSMRFKDGLSVHEVANHFNVAEGAIHKWQQRGWRALSQILFDDEIALRNETQQVLLARLGTPSNSKWQGLERHLQELTALFTDPNGPHIVALEGMGGIGKTSLANAFLRHLLDRGILGSGQFDGCAWVTARNSKLTMGGKLSTLAAASVTSAGLLNDLIVQLMGSQYRAAATSVEQMLAMVQNHIAERPHLIVIDNIETLEDSSALIETLSQLEKPTRILLTSRHNLFDHADVYHRPVDTMAEEDALALIRYEGEQRNLPFIAQASDGDLRPVYELVGGNPLALRLVVGQTHTRALADVLDDLAEARGSQIENLYIYIFWDAWNNLTEQGRVTLLLMPVASERGLNLSDLAHIGDTEPSELRDALEQLVSSNLIERRGGLNESRYTIHSLTRTFLFGQVLKWGDADADQGAE